MVLVVKVSYRQREAERIHVHILVSEETNTNETIAQAVAEATGAAIQVMSVVRAERTHNVEPRLGRPMMKQPTFNWKVAIIKHWLDREGLQFLESLTQTGTRKM